MSTTVNPPVGAHQRTSLAASLYVAAIGVVALFLFAACVVRIDWSKPFGPNAGLFLALTVLAGLAEVRPLRWITASDGVEIAASSVFLLSLVLIAPLSAVVPAAAVAVLIAELALRKSPLRVVFNVAENTIALVAAAAVAELIGRPEDLWSDQGPHLRWLIGAVGAGVACMLVTYVLTIVAVALIQRISVIAMLRESPGIAVAMDFLLFCVAPLLTFIGVRGAFLIPMMLVIIVGMYKSAQVGVMHHHEATHDRLTGLPNHRLFLDQASMACLSAARRERTLAVLLVDLNDFKEINQRLGHAVGDLVLKEVGARLTEDRRPSDCVARIGGDEFAVLIDGAPGIADAEQMAESLLDSLRRPLEVSGVPVAVDASVGLAFYPTHGEDVETLLSQADAAMYRAKMAKRGLFTYDETSDRFGPTRLSLLGDLRDALARNELFVVYQPKIDLASGALSGVEALVRWQHPQRGVLFPDHFMPAAEQTELMDDVTDHILRLAVAQAASWRDRSIDLPVAVNASIRNLTQLKFPDMVQRVLDDFELPAERLELEITENTVTNDPVRAEVVLGKLKQLGVRLSMDDFGTGYSSLAHLRSLPVDRIKIDRTFVHGLVANHGDRVIVRGIIEMASNLGLGTVAEGVEDLATLEILQTMGCQTAQGYQLARPGTAAEIDKLVKVRGTRWTPRLADL